MADENQELQRLAQEVRNALQGLDEATKKASVGLDAFGRELKTVPGQVARGMGNFAKTVGQGDTSFKALNGVVDMAANAMAGLAKTIPLAGEGLAAGIKATAEASKFMLEQMDQTTKAFNDLGQVGALTAKGMTGLQQQFLASGLQLNTFVKQVNENSVALARFRGLTGEGAEDFSKITGELTRGTDDSLRLLGMNAEQIGETVGAFVSQQTRLGRAQTMSNAELTEGAKRYAMELDTLSKVTGMSRAAIQKQQDAALSESRFRAALHGMSDQQQKDFMRLQTVMSGFGQELGQGTRDLISNGVANTDASRKLMADTGGAAADIIRRLKEGSIDATQAQVEMRDAVKANAESQAGIQQYVDGPFSNFANKADLMAAKMDATTGDLVVAQKRQIEGADDLTKNTVNAQKSMEGLNIEVQKLGFTFLPKASSAVASMTTAMEKFVKYVNKTIGAGLDEGDEKAKAAARASGSTADMVNVGHGNTEEEEEKLRASPAYAAARREAGGAPAAPAVAGQAAPAGATTTASQQDLESRGLKIKKGDVQAPGEEISENLINLAKQVQSTIPGFQHFTGFNDRFHNENAPASKHTKGLAMDFVLAQKPSKEEGAKIVDMLKQMGATYVQDEYNNPSAKATAGHIHAEVSAARGAILSGPISGYKPNLTMHGTEAIVPLNKTPSNLQMPSNNGIDPGLMMAQLEKLDEMVSVLKNQLGVSEKLLRYQS